MKKEIKFSLVFRDMWQSAGKYVPRVDQLVKVAPAIIRMGCFDRVETNGGGFEQVNLLFGENPNKAVCFNELMVKVKIILLTGFQLTSSKQGINQQAVHLMISLVVSLV